MNPTRETIAVALANLLAVLGPSPGNATFNTFSRHPAFYDNTSNFPALYIGQGPDDYDYNHGTSMPPEITMNFNGFMYTNTGQDPNILPDTLINNLLDTIESTLQPVPAPAFQQTLGGIVDHAWIDKPGVKRGIDYVTGKGVVLFKIKVLCPQ